MAASTASSSTALVALCSRCGVEGHLARACTKPFFRPLCSACSRLGHLADACPGRARATQHVSQVSCSAGAESNGARRSFATATCFGCGRKGHLRAACPQRPFASIPVAELSEEQREIRSRITALYNGLHSGYIIPDKEVDTVNVVGGSDTYGELQPTASLYLMQALEMGPEDVFFDLGSGTGKLLLFAALASKARSAVGLELSQTRNQVADEAIKAARLEERCLSVSEDFLVSPRLETATVCYSCNTTLPEDSLARLAIRLTGIPSVRLWASLKPVDETVLSLEDNKCFSAAFSAAGVLRLDTTWARRVKVHIYRRLPGSETVAAQRSERRRDTELPAALRGPGQSKTRTDNV